MTTVPLSPRALWLTCALDGRDHAVVDHDPASGAHLSACARTVWASSLASPPATRCADCRDAVGEPATDRRAGRIGRWLGRRAA
ncbi:hypothetical protein [Actinomycetospora sp. TBRC 11914]|uniref:hypothetical protein n=1 Tax=Actinomycetospora sp. TBRC 11914 TaxID=2729387 RepID=UPI00145F72CD|nr:hypothetical protein [Actinomycetospora sp. TBRC 11914]NMO93643.1 hypothetical protein [Actinomycetospora sp. TBRC 11914]